MDWNGWYFCTFDNVNDNWQCQIVQLGLQWRPISRRISAVINNKILDLGTLVVLFGMIHVWYTIRDTQSGYLSSRPITWPKKSIYENDKVFFSLQWNCLTQHYVYTSQYNT